MSGNEESKREAEHQVSQELANQPKQDGPGKEKSKDRRADAEEKLTKRMLSALRGLDRDSTNL